MKGKNNELLKKLKAQFSFLLRRLPKFCPINFGVQQRKKLRKSKKCKHSEDWKYGNERKKHDFPEVQPMAASLYLADRLPLPAGHSFGAG
jgi:hypothetical protein